MSSDIQAEGSWSVHTVDGAEVRLRSGRVGLVSVDVTAPVIRGGLVVTAHGARFSLVLGLDRLRTGNFIMQAAARTLVTRHDARELSYDGSGPSHETGWQVTGTAISGDIALELALQVTPRGPATARMGEIEIEGSANVGTVHLPLPGMGTIEDFSFDVDARLALLPGRS